MKFGRAPFFLFLSFFSFGLAHAASLTIPQNMTFSDQKIALEILGYGSQVRMLSSPVPLGGYQGFEFGLSSEYIPVEDLGNLGNKSNTKGEFNYLSLSFGKGIGSNIDTFVQFTPQSGAAFGYGGHVRWGFFELSNFPALLSATLHGSGMNYVNLVNTRTVGTDLLVTVAVDEASLYFGGGPIKTIGTFQGGTNGVTADGNTDETELNSMHTVFGLSFNFQKLFVAFEIDRVAQSTYAGRVGYRF